MEKSSISENSSDLPHLDGYSSDEVYESRQKIKRVKQLHSSTPYKKHKVPTARKTPTFSASIVSDSESITESENDDDDDECYSENYECIPTEVDSIDIVLYHRNCSTNDTIAASEDLFNVDFSSEASYIEANNSEFYVKWTGKSYLHCTWERLLDLKERSIKGIKKVENYIRNFNNLYWMILNSCSMKCKIRLNLCRH